MVESYDYWIYHNGLTPAWARKAFKRLQMSGSYEQLLDDDLRRESIKAKKQPCDDIIDLGSASTDNAHLLSLIPATLRERFHLATRK